MLWFAPGVLATYCLFAFSVAANRRYGCHKLRTAAHGDKNRLAASLCWAWASSPEITELQASGSEGPLGNIFDFPAPKIWYLYLPHKLFAAMGVLVYQHLLRYGSAFGPGDCPCVPNCSNYFLGCLTRYSLTDAIAKARVRIRGCGNNGTHVCYTADFS